jgi:hypothetical protein
MANLNEVRGKLNAKRAEAAAIFGKYSDVSDMTADDAATVKALNDEMTDLGKDADRLAELEGISASVKAAAPKSAGRIAPDEDTSSAAGGQTTTVKSLAQLMDEADFGGSGASTYRFEIPRPSVKTLLTLGDINNEATRLPGIRPFAVEDRTVADLVLQGTTDNNTLTYMEETTFTNAAANVAEGGTKPESALDFTKRTVPVEKIATWLPVTDELLEDVAGLRTYVEQRLVFMVRRQEEAQLLTGNGTTPNIRGLNNASGIQTQAKGADPTPDAIFKAMQKVRNTGFAEPTAVVMHPNDWTDIRLLRTADGVYIWGSPADQGPERIWGLTIRQTSAQTENTALVGAFTPHAQIFRRSGITVTASTEHSTYFVENKVAVLAEERLGLAIYRPAAFCTVTGI